MFKPTSNTRSRMVARANPEYVVRVAVVFDTLEIIECNGKPGGRNWLRRLMRRNCLNLNYPAKVVREWTYCERRR